MPEGLVAKLTVHDLGSILAYLESLGGLKREGAMVREGACEFRPLRKRRGII
jgi:hypothetical protein